MQNWSHVVADTLNEFESLYVPGDQGDAGKGQVLVRAGYRIYSRNRCERGLHRQVAGPDAILRRRRRCAQDKSDGTWADYLTDILQPDGRRLIALAYTPHNDAIAAGTNPADGWVQPTAAMLEHPGPLVLKSAAPVPGPEPTPPADDAVLAELAEILSRCSMTCRRKPWPTRPTCSSATTQYRKVHATDSRPRRRRRRVAEERRARGSHPPAP